MTSITGTVEVSRSFKEIFGDESITNFTYYPNIHALVVNGRGLFVNNFTINEFGRLSFLFMRNGEVTTIKNGRLVDTEIQDHVFKQYLELLFNTKAAYLSAICKMWKF